MNTLNHKQLTKHIRGRLAHAGIKAKCKMQSFCGEMVVAIDVPSYGVEFTDAEQREIRLIAKVNHLTGPRGMAIDLDRMTDPHGAKFYLGYL